MGRIRGKNRKAVAVDEAKAFAKLCTLMLSVFTAWQLTILCALLVCACKHTYRTRAFTNQIILNHIVLNDSRALRLCFLYEAMFARLVSD
eukprot:1158077-Pelagomonas_calceolata.AAC.8